MNLVLLALLACTASFREPKLPTVAHSVEHTVTGQRALLRRGYPNELTRYARTVRLTIFRGTMGRAMEVRVERDDCQTISGNATAASYCKPAEMTKAIDAFFREAFIADRTVELTRDDLTRRIQLADFLNERRIVDPFFLQDHRVFSWVYNAHELIVEAKR